VAAAQAAVGAARAQVKVQEVARSFTEIRAPFDGVVLVKNANVGDVITPLSSAAGTQGAVVTMADLGTLEVEADVSESSLAQVRQGQPVEVLLDALPGVRFLGQVGAIVPTVDRAKATVTTKVRFDQLDARILPEMSAKVNFLKQPITAADQQPLLAAPPAAVVREGSTAQVFKLVPVAGQADRFTARAVPVKQGRSLGEVLEITPLPGGVEAALKAGDRLALSPAGSPLKEGVTVRLEAP
jgi:multidrug efflux pump subunit AcrA (membrane-fusion protein)